MSVIVAAMLAVLLWPTPEGLTVEGQKSLAIFVLCVGFWVTGALPLHITSILAIALVPLLGIQSARQTYSYFGNQAVFFILGAFILSAGVNETGLSTRVALSLLERFGRTPASLRRSIFFIAAFSSFFVSEHAVAALAFIIVLEVVRVLGLKPGRSEYGRSLFLALSWGCIIGGIGTLLGGARAPLAVGMLEEATGIQIGFFQWMVAGLPTVIGALIAGTLLLHFLFKIDIDSVEPARQLLRDKIEKLGPVTRQEKIAGAIMAAAVFSWMFLRSYIGLADTALLAVVALFVFRIVDWRKMEENINWGIILMYGGAICLGTVMDHTGAARWLTSLVLVEEIQSPFLLIAILALVTLMLTECISNAAVIALLFPVVLELGQNYGISAEVMTFALTFPAGLSFMLPMGTPATAIAYSSGFFRPIEMIRAGLLIVFCSWILFVLTALFWWPLLGYQIG